MPQNNCALIAMSGGVDSSVAAYRMLCAGFSCRGVMMHLYPSADGGRREDEDAAAVAKALSIPFEVLDCTAAFRETIIQTFIDTYEAGETPNPCVDCNRQMKFGRLLQYARENGCSCLVTGHYARIERDAGSGRYLLKKARDASKDQSYVLYSLTQEQLAHIRFPLGDLTKAQVREIAAGLGFGNADRPDSQDICFIPDGDYTAFLETCSGKHYPPGCFLDESGAVVGTHRGAVRYTIGQRKGLGLALGQPVYVCRKDMDANTVTVGPESALYAPGLLADHMNWIAFPAPAVPFHAAAKTRYRQQEQPATVYPQADGSAHLIFDEPQRAITPGQSVVLYQGDTVVGGGVIRRALQEQEGGCND